MSVIEQAHVGDEITISGPGHSGSSSNLHGEILEIFGRPGEELFRVLWADGTVTVVPPGAVRTTSTPRSAPARIRVLGSPSNLGSVGLVQGWRELGLAAELVSGDEALRTARPDDIVIGRLDVLPSLDGVEPGLLALLLLERRGARVINSVDSLLTAHDKLRSAAILTRSRLPHPKTASFTSAEPGPPLAATVCREAALRQLGERCLSLRERRGARRMSRCDSGATVVSASRGARPGVVADLRS